MRMLEGDMCNGKKEKEGSAVSEEDNTKHH